MLRSARLQNYRKHADLTVTFGDGLNTIRAANEAGKSTLIEAIIYALFGTKALPESLDDVVTYGLAASKLRVDLFFEHLGVEYTLYRAKSGCELNFGEHKVTGQTEVTRYIESIFGVDAAMASKMMLASQSELRGALKDGPTAAGRMIEQLADFDLLDRIKDLIQTKLPAGNTDGAEARIAQLRAQLAEPEATFNVGELEFEVTRTVSVVRGKEDVLKCSQDRRALLDTAGAQKTIAEEAAARSALPGLQTTIDNLTEQLGRPLPEAPSAAELAAAQADVEAEANWAAANKLHDELVKANVQVLWDQDYELLQSEVRSVEGRVQKHSGEIADLKQKSAQLTLVHTRNLSELKVERAKLEGQVIKETTCSLCQKDLTDVPEVVTRNAALAAKLADVSQREGEAQETYQSTYDELTTCISTNDKELREAQDYLRQLQAVVQRNGVIEALYSKAGALVVLDRSVVPAKWQWAGPDLSSARPEVRKVLADLQEQLRVATSARARHDEQARQLNQLQVDLSAKETQLQHLASMLITARAVLVEAQALDGDITSDRTALQDAQHASLSAVGALNTARAVLAQQARQRAQLQSQLDEGLANLTEMQANNALVKKVQAARPAISTKLWNLVLAAVSKDFSQIRGEHSVITRDSDRFLVNGRPVAGLSGSAKDSLGLAIRVALTKTFLPTMSFMSLDEPASACSDEREVSMLGMLATTGFNQILLVTHSDLADSFSDRIITI
jgi:exonuclease SbcC